MKNMSELTNNHRDSFFSNFKKEEELDETTFKLWKNELQNQLPDFWEQINNIRKRL
jgi:hypothetical protein